MESNLKNKKQAFEIHAFEPSIHTFKILESNTKKLLQNIDSKNCTILDSINSEILETNDIKITLNNCGLGLQNETLTLYYDSIASGLSSLARRRLEHFNIDFSMSERVQIRSLDNYCAAFGITHIHLLKIDVEGFELNVLNGAREMFKRGAIDIVTFEFGGCNIDTRTYFQDFWYFFKEQKYQIYRILPNEKLYKIEQYKELYEQFVTTNYIALRQDFRI
ncbi:FkbM family methyltransferase [Helicobacter saguini]|uniref:FkbM family methyltransferase n=1 Tax=Helicobacter saguini TaxID=1548018 RepID=A0A347VHJ2_9HELI|nr:FkbM family methyltransferase [Helicobacter saguini]MWV67014.1 FkbM family methyltransferase [Helicobacter saguini]MWV71083.1 FkbM family methyltransferase [Helicobacter saguini]TLD95019.1 FkbM family methyltransferase [Helicobacter saguini]